MLRRLRTRALSDGSMFRCRGVTMGAGAGADCPGTEPGRSWPSESKAQYGRKIYAMLVRPSPRPPRPIRCQSSQRLSSIGKRQIMTRSMSGMFTPMPSEVVDTINRIVDDDFLNSSYRQSRSNLDTCEVNVSTTLKTQRRASPDWVYFWPSGNIE